MHAPIETQRLILRAFTLDDVDAVYQMNLEPEVTRYTHDGGVQPREVVEARIRDDYLGDHEKWGFGRLAVVLKADQRVLGICGLKRVEDDPETDLGYRFRRDCWGRGYATESATAVIAHGFEQLGLQIITATARLDNEASFRVMSKLGMQEIDRMVTGDRAVKYGIRRDAWLDR